MSKSDIVLTIIVLALVGLSFHAGYNGGFNRATDDIEVKSDTIWKTRVIRNDTPTPIKTIIVGSVPYPIPLPVIEEGDVVRDTVYIPVPIEQKTYEDSLYRLQISGIDPNLDWIEIYSKTIEVTNSVIIPRKKFGFSIGVGPGAIYSPFSKSFDAGIGIFGGLTYTF